MPVHLDFDVFREPTATWRSVPFWSLNDRLEPAEIDRQLVEFATGGFGGAYLHSRIGLLTEYLGEDWWQAMDAGVAACERLGLEAWFYDEDKWPSGFAGGIVPSQSEDFHARALVRLTRDAELPAGAVVLATDDQYQYLAYQVPWGNPWFNGTCWVDLLNPAMVKAFIDCSYEPYGQRYADRLGTVVHGIFTDEPQFSPQVAVPHQGAVPYSPVLHEDFRRDHGYDFTDHLACLFDDVGEFAQVRSDYYRTLARRFEASFSKQIGDWCDAARMVWTGHYNGEGGFRSVMLNVGNLMIQYRHQQRPGIDHLGLHIDLGSTLLMMKSLSSVANQYGRDRRLSEMFGISGQNLSFEDRRWIADYHALLGVNHICPHLSLYSLKGCRKRDYPPTISPQQPYWSENKRVEDAMARASYLSSVGRFAPELLVLVPLESAYIDYAASTPDTLGNQRNRRFVRVLEALQRSHRDYDLGDEQILADIGAVAGRELSVGQMSYPAVLLPVMRTIRATTIELLARFNAAGGAVFGVGGLPELVDGRADTEALARLAQLVRPLPEDDLAAALAVAWPAAVTVTGEQAGEVWTHRRVGEAGGDLLMLFNRSRLHTAQVSVALPAAADQPLVWDPSDGQARRLTPQADGTLGVRLAPAQSLFVSTGAVSAAATPVGDYAVAADHRPLVELFGLWQIERHDPNAITLDFARWQTPEVPYAAAEPVLGIHERFTDQRWSGPLQLAFDLTVEVLPAAAALVVEQPEMYRSITVNGQPADFGGGAYYRDLTFRQAEVTGALRPGLNTIELTLDYVAPIPDSRDAVTRYGSEIESIYLVGDFAVAAEVSPEPPRSLRNERGDLPPRPVHRLRRHRLTAEPATTAGDLALDGYPFYAGGFTLSREFELPAVPAGRRVWLSFPAFEAITIAATVNGQTLPTVAWSPWEVDITEALRAGRNRLALRLVNSLRNLLGPHHHFGGELIEVGPVQFSARGSWPYYGPGDQDWYEQRKSGAANLWRDDYFHIAFGLLGPVDLLCR